MEPRSFFSIARKSVLAIAIAAITIPATALTTSTVDPVEETAAVKYIGSEAQTMLFNVKYNNVNASKFIVTIKDQDGITLFQSSFTDVVFDKKFSLPKGTDASKLIFTISDKKNNYSESFEVSTETRVVEDVLVKKVN